MRTRFRCLAALVPVVCHGLEQGWYGLQGAPLATSQGRLDVLGRLRSAAEQGRVNDEPSPGNALILAAPVDPRANSLLPKSRQTPSGRATHPSAAELAMLETLDLLVSGQPAPHAHAAGTLPDREQPHLRATAGEAPSVSPIYDGSLSSMMLAPLASASQIINDTTTPPVWEAMLACGICATIGSILAITCCGYRQDFMSTVDTVQGGTLEKQSKLKELITHIRSHKPETVAMFVLVAILAWMCVTWKVGNVLLTSMLLIFVLIAISSCLVSQTVGKLQKQMKDMHAKFDEKSMQTNIANSGLSGAASGIVDETKENMRSLF